MRKLMLCSAMLALAAGGPAAAHHAGEVFQAGAIVVSHAWMPANASMAHASVVYLTVDNQGDAPDRLIGAEVAFADDATFQARTLSPEGVLKTQEIAAIEIEPGQVVTLQPGHAWIELEGVHATFAPGQHFEMQLTFAKAGPVTVEVEVEPVEPDSAQERST